MIDNCKKPHKTNLKGLFILNFSRRCFAICITPLLIGCTWLDDIRHYEKISEKAYETEKIVLADNTSFDNINGLFPDEIYIKTSTQTYTRDFQFCLDNGLIYYKGRNPEIAPFQWELLAGTGLPHSKDKDLISPKRITRLSADIDSLMVFSDEGTIFGMFFDDLLRVDSFIWYWAWGFPVKTSLSLNEIVLDYRGLASGTRREDILWYEDIFGNEHHFGLMGLETLYILTEDGSQIRFSDTGLPADFSRSFLNPERGSFIARNISASGSTIFLINDAGEMYTRLIDFDTMGGDPMFFKYTYEKTKQSAKGTEYKTNFTDWGLPAEDWMKHEEIQLSGEARISKYITIMQNGQGNFAREMMVAGLNENGQTGYYTKQLLDTTWTFVKTPFLLPADSFLDPSLDRESLRIPAQEYAYTGSLRVDNKTLDLSIDDMPLSEGYCTLDISYNGEIASWRVHPVEIWSFFIRGNPGFDGYPKQFFISFEQTPAQKFQNSALSAEFQDLLLDIFKDKELTLFSSWAEATSNFFHMQIPQTPFGDLEFTLVSNEVAQNISDDALETALLPFNRTLLYDFPIFASFISESFTLPEQDFSVADTDLVEKFIIKNENLLELMYADIIVTDSYDREAKMFHHGYNVADFIAALTLIKLIDTPKIKTLTMHMGDIQKRNNNLHKNLHDIREILYPHFNEVLIRRISAYKQLRSDIQTAGTATLDAHFKSTFGDYFDALFFPDSISGSSDIFDSDSVIFERITTQPLFPGFFITDNNSDLAVIVELKNPLDTLTNALQDNSSQHSFDVIIQDIKMDENYAGTLNLGTEKLQIIKNPVHENIMIFETFLKE